MSVESSDKGDTGGGWPKPLMAIALALCALAGVAYRLAAKRKGWVPATAGVLALLFTVASCEMFGVNQKVAAWTAVADKTLYFHNGIAPGPTVITNSTGAVWQERRYEPFGQPIDAFGLDGAQVDFNAEPQNALGKMTNPNTGWSDHGARWMMPQIARWSAPDPAIKGPDPAHAFAFWDLNPYAFVRQAPSLNWDPDGQVPDKIGNKASQAAYDELESRTAGSMFHAISMLDIVINALNISPKTVETLAQSGALARNTSFLGVAGEFVAFNKIINENLQVTGASHVNFPITTSQLQPPIGDGSYFDFAVAIAGKCSSCGLSWPAGIKVKDAIHQSTGGQVGVANLGSASTGLYVEATTSKTFEHILARGLKVGAVQSVFNKENTTTLQGVAALAIDRGAYFGLTDTQKDAVKTAVGSGMIILVRDLRNEALKTAQDVEKALQ